MGRISEYEMDDRDFTGPVPQVFDIVADDWRPMTERELAERPGPDGSLFRGLAFATLITAGVTALGVTGVVLAWWIGGAL